MLFSGSALSSNRKAANSHVLQDVVWLFNKYGGRFNVLLVALDFLRTIARKSLQTLMCRAVTMMHLLILDVVNNPFQILGSKRHDAITSLPLQGFWLDLVVYVMRA